MEAIVAVGAGLAPLLVPVLALGFGLWLFLIGLRGMAIYVARGVRAAV